MRRLGALSACRCAAVVWLCAAAVVQADEASCSASPSVEHAQPRLLSANPRVYLLEGFLNGTEIEHLYKVAREIGVFDEAIPDPNDKQDGRGYHQEYVDESRYAVDALLDGIEERISAQAYVPRDPGAAATISVNVRNATEAAGMTNLHHDHNAAAMAIQPFAKQGRRVPLTELQATLLAYFSDVEQGGETIFPCICNRAEPSCQKAQSACKFLYENGVLNVHPKGHNSPFKLQKVSDEVRTKIKKAAGLLVKRSVRLCSGEKELGLSVPPQAGRAILFYSNGVRGQADPRVWHGSCRVTAGQKMAIQRFLYAPQTDEETGAHAVATFQW